ncbi:hypothetical protein J6590_007247 [Homalodisca vitripennis]|nr:hypothetical protein J6590_007247 [Homalodisca vitripennis]
MWIFGGTLKHSFFLLDTNKILTTRSGSVHKAEQYEEYLRARNTYRPPPLPSLALVPETAYCAKKKIDKSHETSAVSENGVTKTKPAQVENEMSCTIRGEVNHTQRRTTETKIVKPNVQKDKREHNVRFQTPVNTVRRICDDTICWNCEKGGHFFENARGPRP